MTSKSKKIGVILLGLIGLGIIIYGILMIKHRIDFAVTNAVFVDTDNISNVGFERVGGKIVNMFKEEGEKVKKGEILAEIDSMPYRLVVKELNKKIKSLIQKRDKLYIVLIKTKEELKVKEEIAKDKINQLRHEINALKDQISSIEDRIKQSQRDVRRYRDLYQKGAVAKRALEELTTQLSVLLKEKMAQKNKLKGLLKSLDIAKKELRLIIVQRKNLLEIKKSINSLNDEIKSLKAKLDNAKLNLKYCKLKSPIDGKIAKKYVSIGDVVAPGTPVYAIVNPKDIYILVLLEETKLKGVKPGCPVKIKIDAYPKEKYLGVVEKILPTSAAKFALVPRDISAGEFTKVVQRMQVKVKIVKGDVNKLVVGMGGEVEIKREK